jgi:hypothetical protein
MSLSFKHEILEIELKSPKSYYIGKIISTIYDKKIKIPKLSKFIIDPNHTMGIPFENWVKNLSNLDLLYLFNTRLTNIKNFGCRLKLTNSNKREITCADLTLFIFDDDGAIEIIKNPKKSNEHIIGILQEQHVKTDISNYIDILLFSADANIEDNINLHNNILKLFPDYTIKTNLNNAIINSIPCYDKDDIDKYKCPLNMWGINDGSEDYYRLYMRINIYLDTDLQNLKTYLIDIFKRIGAEYENISISETEIDFNNKIIYAGISEHKNNYRLISISDDIQKLKMDAVCNINNISGINGNYLIPNTEELDDPDSELSINIKKEISNIIIHISNFIDGITIKN